MKKIAYVIVLLIILTGCQQKITTYKEVIEDGKVEIDGISYDIKFSAKASLNYDNNGNLIESVGFIDDSEMRTEYSYQNNQLIEERRYVDDEVTFSINHYYKNKQLSKTLTRSYSDKYNEGVEERISEYTYGELTRTEINKDSNGNILGTKTTHLDESDKILGYIFTNPKGEIVVTSTCYYENDELIKVVRNGDGVYNTTMNYEYNNIGDVIVEYAIYHGEKSNLMAVFYEYEYNEKLLPKTRTVYRIQAPIDEENIRDY